MRKQKTFPGKVIGIACLLIIQLADIKAQDFMDETGLLETTWGGSTLFNKYNPGNHSPGCHSMALAQICYYHRLQPIGQKNYVSSKGDTIAEDFSKYIFNWDLFVNRLDEATPSEEVDEVARYVYSIAAIVEKNFGTGSYQRTFHKGQLKKHLPCKVKERAGYRTFLLSRRKVRNLIVKEIDDLRPVYFHYTDFDGGGHSVVIDAYQWKENDLWVHANYGWGGKKNGWYQYEKDCFLENTKVELLILIKPKP